MFFANINFACRKPPLRPESFVFAGDAREKNLSALAPGGESHEY
jgi:hypothetical protein